MFEVLAVSAGDRVRVQFESSNSPWRQGVWLATEGTLQAAEVQSAQVLLWMDTAPEIVEIEVAATDGLLRFYNVWDSGRGFSDRESQSATSGMVVDEVAPGTNRYSCNDIGFGADFDKLVFTVAIDIAEATASDGSLLVPH